MSACCCGARTGLLVPAEPAVTFERGVSVGAGGSRLEIWQAAPYASTPEGRARVPGLAVESHAVHTGGDWLAYSTRDGLFTREWRGYGTRVSTQQGINGIAWTADARRLAYTAADRVWVVNAGGSSAPTPVTPPLADAADERAASPSWTPDGGRLVFIRYRQTLDSGGNPTWSDGEVWSVAADGGDLRRLSAGGPAPTRPGLAVTRDGSAAIYATGSPAAPSLVRLDFATNTVFPLLANASQPAFSGTGQGLAFVRQGQVLVCRFAGGTCTNERQISNGTFDHTPSWVGW